MTNDELVKRFEKIKDIYPQVSRWGFMKSNLINQMDTLDCLLFWYFDVKIKDYPINIILNTFRNKVSARLEIEDDAYEDADFAKVLFQKHGIFIGSRATDKLKYMVPETEAHRSELVMYNLSEEALFKGRFVDVRKFGNAVAVQSLLFKSINIYGIGDMLYGIASRRSPIFDYDDLGSIAKMYTSEEAIKRYLCLLIDDHRSITEDTTQELRIVCEPLVKSGQTLNNALAAFEISHDANAFFYSLFTNESDVHVSLPELCL